MYTALGFVAGVLFCIGVSALAVLWEAQVKRAAYRMRCEEYRKQRESAQSQNQ